MMPWVMDGLEGSKKRNEENSKTRCTQCGVDQNSGFLGGATAGGAGAKGDLGFSIENCFSDS